MGQEDHVIQLEELGLDQGLVFIDIQAGAPDLSGLQSLKQRFFVDYGAAGYVD